MNTGVLEMKKIIFLMFLLLNVGCNSSSSNDSTSQLLEGAWKSNCHEIEENTFRTYEFIFTDDTVLVNITRHSDCDEEGVVSDFPPTGTFQTSEKVETTNGGKATRLSFVWDGPLDEVNPKEFVYKIKNNELNMGNFMEGEIPEIDYTITYIKQE
jgi:hypothetical protein